MTRAPHICTCGKIVAYGVICQCKVAAIRARNRRHDANRPSARQRGYDRRWQAARKDWLAYNPACTRCRAPATVVDHITPHKGDKAVFWDKTNWQSLCAPCHNRHKQREERRT
tara:strand:- start:1185 stop:1523 length:339 start_codon:yes stop_codon:yes gene_type:complete